MSPPADRTVPGFSAADSSLMSIEHVGPLHPTSITLFSTLRKDDLLPRDVAVEMLPWLSTPPKEATTVKEQYDSLFRPGVFGAMRQYFAMSLAISQDVTPAGATESLSQVSVGVRTFVLGGKSNSRLEGLVEEFTKASAELDAAAVKREPPDQTAEDRLADLFLRTRTLRQQIAEADKSRVGFLTEVGAALVYEVPKHTLSQGRVGRHVVWVNPIYRVNRFPVDFAGIARYIDERWTHSRLIDSGGRVSARRNGVHYSFEALGRHRWVDEHTPGEDLNNARLVTGITYGFNQQTQVNFAFGKNFKNDFSGGGSLLASFGLTIGLGETPLSTDE